MSWLYSQALVEEFLGENFSDGEQSVPLSGKPIQQAYCAPDKMTGFSRLSRFGMTYKPLTESRGEELLTLYLAAFHAKTSQPRGGGRELMAKDQECGEKWRGSFTKYSLDSFSWKTHQCSLLGDLDEFSETWPKWGLMRDGECWEAKMLGPFTEETEFGLSLPTIVKSDSNATSKNRFLNSPHFRGAKMSEGLRICVTDPTSVHPSFGEKTMGWPTMWTGLAPLGMDKFQEWQQQHGQYLVKEFND